MRPYPEYVRRRKGVIFGMLAKKGAETAEEAVGLLSEAYPNFSEYHSDLASEWIEKKGAKRTRKRRRRAKASAKNGRKIARIRVPKQGGEPHTGRRGRPRNADRVIGGIPAAALKTVTEAFPSTEYFLAVHEAVEELGGKAKVLQLFAVFGR